VNVKKVNSKSKTLTRPKLKSDAGVMTLPNAEIPASHLFSIEEIQLRAEEVTPLLQGILNSHPPFHRA